MAKEKRSRLYAEKLAVQVRKRNNVIEVLRELVRLRKARFTDIPRAVADRNPGLKLENTQVTRVLKYAQSWGLVFKDPESDYYHPTTLAMQIVWDEQHIDWLPSACLAWSIVTDSKPGVDLVKTLSEELHLDMPQAQDVLTVFKNFSLQRPQGSTYLGRCLERGGPKVDFVPTVYPHPLPNFPTRNDPIEDNAKKDAAEKTYAPLMDTVAERILLDKLRSVGYGKESAGRDKVAGHIRSVPMGQGFLQACEGNGVPGASHVFRPRNSVLSMSSPKVNPFALDLMLRYEAPISFSENFEVLTLERHPDMKPTEPLKPSPDKDYAVLLRFVDPATRVSHFVLFGIYPPGTLAAARYFDSNIDELLNKYADTPFVVVLESERPTIEKWNGDDVVYWQLYEETFEMVSATYDIEIRCQPAFEALLWLASKYPVYFTNRLGLDIRKILDGTGYQLRKANRLMACLQEKNILVSAVIDALLTQSFTRQTPDHRRTFVKKVRDSGNLSSVKKRELHPIYPFEFRLLDYTWDLIDAQQEYVNKQLDHYAFCASDQEPNRLILAFCESSEAKSEVARTKSPTEV